MHRISLCVLTLVGAACSASAGSLPAERATTHAPIAEPVRHGPASVDLTGNWATGSMGEPDVKRIVLRPQCAYHPPAWVIQQIGDTLRAWTFRASHDQGVPSPRAASARGAEGWVSGMDAFIRTDGTGYVLHYDSTSGHLRGTLNGTPFWAIRQDIVQTELCPAVP